jgi:hypothetical protein
MGLRVLALTVLALGVTAAPAGAAAVAPLKPCYVSAGEAEGDRENVVISGEGFTPGATVDILVDGILQAQPKTDSRGMFRGTIDAPYQESGEARFEVVVRDTTNPLVSLTVASRVTDLDARLRPRTAASSDRVRMRGRGFTRDAPLFAHYLYGDDHVKSVRLARRTKGDCGAFGVRRRQIPVDDPASGRWTIQIDQRRRYSAEPRPVWVRVPVTVRREFAAP